MLALKILEADVRRFMNGLLRENVFDSFEVRNGEISQLVKFEISGSLDRDFLPEGAVISEARAFCTWTELKPYVLNIIKGSKRPKAMKLVFSYPSEKCSEINSNASALFLNIMFSDNEILCTTANSQKNFALDKEVDIYWDDYIKNFFSSNNFVFLEE